jgi:hypothetical protein
MIMVPPGNAGPCPRHKNLPCRRGFQQLSQFPPLILKLFQRVSKIIFGEILTVSKLYRHEMVFVI